MGFSLASLFHCYGCQRVGLPKEGRECLQCGSKSGELISNEEFVKGQKSGRFFPVDKSGKRI
jgi:hypothetical protein